MKSQIVFQNLLREELVRIQGANASYSLRAFAKKAGVHVGALSSIMGGKRNVSRKLAERVLGRLLVDPQKRSEVLDLFPQSRRKNVVRPVDGDLSFQPRYLELSAAAFRIIADWEHFAILCLFRMKDFSSDRSWIERKLGLSAKRIDSALKRLKDLSLIEITSDGSLKRTTQSVRTSDDIAEVSLKKSHEQSLDLAKNSLFRDPVHLRDHTSITMAIDPKKIGMAKEMIRKFQDELAEVLESDRPTEVYRLSMQLFPLFENERQNP